MFWKYLLYHAALWMTPTGDFAQSCEYSPPTPPVSAVCPMPEAKTYVVSVQFTSGHSTQLKTAVCEGEPMTRSHGKLGSAQGEKTWDMGVRVAKSHGEFVDLECELGVVNLDGQRCTHRAETTVQLGEVNTVYLKTPGPEPCCAEVTVRRLAAEMPAPLPVAYVQNPVPPQVVMPAPMPIALPAPALTTVPYVAEPMRFLQHPPPLLPTPIQLVGATAITRVITKSYIRLVRDCDKSRLHLSTEAGTMTCVRLTLDKGAVGPITIAAGKERVHLSGKQWKAHADEVDVCEDGRIFLRGRVRLTTDKIGTGAVVEAEELSVEVKQGKFEKIVTK